MSFVPMAAYRAVIVIRSAWLGFTWVARLSPAQLRSSQTVASSAKACSGSAPASTHTISGTLRRAARCRFAQEPDSFYLQESQEHLSPPPVGRVR